jgi:hypothetical protein
MSRWEEIGQAMRELKLAVENLESMIQSGCPHETETHREYANCRVFYCVDCGQELRTDMKI